MDTDFRSWNQPLFYGEWGNARKNIAAVLLSRNQRLVGEDLKEEIIDICVGPFGFGNDCDLRSYRLSAA